MTDLAHRSEPLYALTAQYQDILELVESDDPDVVEQALDAISEKIHIKANSIAALVREFETRADQRAVEIARMKALADADQRHAKRLREYLLHNMQSLGTDRIETTAFSVRIRTNPPSVQVVDEQQIPDEFFRVVTTRSVDKKAILDVLKSSGVIVDGVEIVRGSRLEIR